MQQEHSKSVFLKKITVHRDAKEETLLFSSSRKKELSPSAGFVTQFIS
jgi:hypothetical protein